MADSVTDRDAHAGAKPDRLPDVVSSRLIYSGKVVSLRVDEIAMAGGGVATREVVDHPGAVVVVALDDEGYVYLVRQYRHAIGRHLLELPAGGLEADEQPLAAAKRELREEVGLWAEKWSALGSFFSSPGFANELLHAFLAQDLSPVERDLDDDEDISVVRYPLEGLLEAMKESADAKTLAALHLLSRVVEADPGLVT